MKSIDPDELAPRDVYRLMISAIVPRPIALVSTLSAEGQPNLAPFSYFAGVSARPPLLSISIGRGTSGDKDTLRNIRATHGFVVNIVNRDIAKQMVVTSGEYTSDVDEFRVAGLTPLASEVVMPARVKESPLHLECRAVDLFDAPGGAEVTLVIGRILRFHVSPAVFDREKGVVDPVGLNPVGRLGGDLYATLSPPFSLARPKIER